MLKVSLPILFILSFIAALIFAISVFKVKEVRLVQTHPCLPENFQKESGIDGKDILFISSQKLENGLKDKFPCIDEIKIAKNFPSKITINITAKQPIVRIEGTNLLISESGQVTENTASKDNPIIYLPQEPKPQVGQIITDTNVLSALKITSALLKSDFMPSTIRFLKDDIAIYNRQGLVVLFSAKKEIDKQVDSLQQVLSQAKIDATKITKIDLRFDKPVIEYKTGLPSLNSNLG